VDIFAKDLVIVPTHVHGNHWTLAAINFKMRRFECAGAAQPPARGAALSRTAPRAQVLRLAARLARPGARHAAQVRRGRVARQEEAGAPCAPPHTRRAIDSIALRPAQSFDFSGWGEDAVFKVGTPQQKNGWDCGVFMCACPHGAECTQFS
jgi:hypothetical protein